MSATGAPAVPALTLLTQIRCDVGPVQSLGPAPHGERRFVALLGGTAHGPCLSGEILPGGVDWQVARGDHALDIDAHYVIRTPAGATLGGSSTSTSPGCKAPRRSANKNGYAGMVEPGRYARG